MISRVGQFISNVARHALPIGGIFGREWHPATALMVYWVESVLLVLSATALCVLIRRRHTEIAITAAAAEGDDETARALEAERVAYNRANLNPNDILVVYFGSMMIFGGFLAGVIFIMVSNGFIAPLRWSELGDGTAIMAAIIALVFLFDLWRLDSIGVSGVAERVESCTARWALFWMVGFFGTLLMVYTGRALMVFGTFAILKATFESWGTLARLFGWKPVRAST